MPLRGLDGRAECLPVWLLEDEPRQPKDASFQQSISPERRDISSNLPDRLEQSKLGNPADAMQQSKKLRKKLEQSRNQSVNKIYINSQPHAMQKHQKGGEGIER